MYYIQQGDCIGNIKDISGNKHIAVQLLVSGKHFGEIGMIYKIPRTMTIICRNYNTMAMLEYNQYREITNLYPRFRTYLEQHIYDYEDPNLSFIKSVINKIEFMKSTLNVETLHNLIYKLEKVNYIRGDTIFKAYDGADSILIIGRGFCEVTTYFEGNEFILEKLGQGSAINHRAFFLEDLIYVNIRCATNVTILKLSREAYKALQNEN